MADFSTLGATAKHRRLAGAGMAALVTALAAVLIFLLPSVDGSGSGRGGGAKAPAVKPADTAANSSLTVQVKAPGKVPMVAAIWTDEWPKTDFSRSSVDLREIRSGGPPKDGIPSIDSPKFIAVGDVTGVKDTEPVISLRIGSDARAYPLSVLMWHEIVNDTVGGVPVAVTFCPLCNAAVVFNRRLEGRVLDFGTTGKLRRSDLVMYDRQTESWWQQFLGEAIIGQLTGKRLEFLPSRIESFARFKARFPKGRYLVPNNPHTRRYGANPYAGYDSLARPWLYKGAMPKGIAPLARVVSIGKQAWSLDLVREKKRITHGDYVITWEAGQNSALDKANIAEGRDVGNVVVQKNTPQGLVDAVHGVDFAFAFHAFHPGGVIHTK
ncbi:MAG: DUF3179 domain-containing protein [Alphaproteobacteria bacterium]|nr:DUF3179 domain-containing protein [Alphaproteobacteria bacterium]